jgi:hypothetical protein
MIVQRRPDLETLLRHLEIVGFAVLTAWSVVGLYGTLGGYLAVNRQATLRFLLAILVIVFAHDVLVHVRERRLQQLPPDERYGFVDRTGRDVATGSPQTEG